MFALNSPEVLSETKTWRLWFHVVSAAKWCVQSSNVQLNYQKLSLHPSHVLFQGKQNNCVLLIADKGLNK